MVDTSQHYHLHSLHGEVSWQTHAAVDGSRRHTLDCVKFEYHGRVGVMMSLTVQSILMLMPFKV